LRFYERCPWRGLRYEGRKRLRSNIQF